MLRDTLRVKIVSAFPLIKVNVSWKVLKLRKLEEINYLKEVSRKFGFSISLKLNNHWVILHLYAKVSENENNGGHENCSNFYVIRKVNASRCLSLKLTIFLIHYEFSEATFDWKKRCFSLVFFAFIFMGPKFWSSRITYCCSRKRLAVSFP